jgi:hypothetical protein
MPRQPPVLLRLKLLRGGAGIKTDSVGSVTSVGGGAAQREGVVQVHDRVVGDAFTIPTTPCEISVLRQDDDLAEALISHGMLTTTRAATPCFQQLKIPIRRDDTSGLGLVMSGLQVQELCGR